MSVPVAVPRSVVLPSPKLTDTFRIVVPLPAAGVTATVNVAAAPASAGPLAAIDTTGTGRPVMGIVNELVTVGPEGAPVSAGAAPATAVTTAADVVVSVVWTLPFESVFAFAGVMLPELVENATGANRSGLLDASVTTAVTVLLPPPNGTDSGVAVSETRPGDAVGGSGPATVTVEGVVGDSDAQLAANTVNATVASPARRNIARVRAIIGSALRGRQAHATGVPIDRLPSLKAVAPRRWTSRALAPIPMTGERHERADFLL